LDFFNVCESIENFNKLYKTGNEITSLEFDSDGIGIAIGTLKGQIGIFDLRKKVFNSLWFKLSFIA